MDKVWIIEGKTEPCRHGKWEIETIYKNFADADKTLKYLSEELPERDWRMISRTVY